MLVQYLLLLRGIESAPMTTDSGIDLVAYSAASGTPRTIQVKTNLRPKPSGGTGKPALDWSIPHKSPAQIVAVVDLSGQQVWLFECSEFTQYAQQNKAAKGLHLYMYSDPQNQFRRPGKLVNIVEFERFLLPNRITELFS